MTFSLPGKWLLENPQAVLLVQTEFGTLEMPSVLIQGTGVTDTETVTRVWRNHRAAIWMRPFARRSAIVRCSGQRFLLASGLCPGNRASIVSSGRCLIPHRGRACTTESYHGLAYRL